MTPAGRMPAPTTPEAPPTTPITGLTTFPVAYPEPNDNGATRHLLFVRVETADGTCGWGEAITQFAAPTRATEELVRELADLVVGSDPMHNEAMWHRLKDHTWWYGFRGGLTAFAISAIDIALWDLKGKLLGRPLVDLLGGPVRTELPAVASTHAFLPELEQEVERHRAYVHDQGYVGVKVGMGKRGEARLGYDHARDVEFVRLLREALGPGPWIMMDRGKTLGWDVADAIRRTRAFEEFDLKWIEEPLEPLDVEGFRRLRRHVRCLVAGGEREWDADGFRAYIDTGVVDVVGCDPGRAEGITGVRSVIESVERAGIWFNSHAWSGAVITAASLALSASTPRCLLQELKPDPSPMQHELVETPFEQRGGVVGVPGLPGLGVELREDVLRRYRPA